ncbi:MAG: D-alanyl-D-alanine carboxypeptidase/D-alanyl-D-alanine-endopeptidase [Thermoanaerobaculia bacterium]
MRFPVPSFRRTLVLACLVAGLLPSAPGAGAAAGDDGARPAAGRTRSKAVARPASLDEALGHELDYARRVSRALGVDIVDLSDGRTVFEYAADEKRILASNTKLLTTATALATLGPEYKFSTGLAIRGAVEAGTLEGDLAVLGGGDPNISGRFHDGDSFAVFREWAAALKSQGIERVTGDLLLVNGLFREPRVHPSWPRDQLTTWYEAPVEALSFEDNCVLVRVWPSSRVGAPVRVETVPRLDYFVVQNTARTAEKGTRSRLVITRADDSDTLVVSGWMPRGGPVEDWVAVYDPMAYFGAALRAALAIEGVAIGGATRLAEAPLPAEWKTIYTYESDLPRTLEVTNKRSQNFYAECLAKFLGWKEKGEGSWPTGTSVIKGFLTSLGIGPEAVQLEDGSGLSRGNQMTPRAMTRLLSAMYFHEYGREFMRTLPYSGESGLAWRHRLANPPYRENVFAKTGTINGVSTLSGYAKAQSGRVYAFSILCNQVRSNSGAHEAQDRIVRALIDRG